MASYDLPIGGKMVPGDLTMLAINPAIAEEFAKCPRPCEALLRQAVAAGAALPGWSRTSMDERCAPLLRTADATGEVMDRPGYFVRPAIVRGIKEGGRPVDEEQLGPALPVIEYSDDDEAIRRADAATYGRRLGLVLRQARAHRIATRREAGTVWIDEHLDLVPSIPFGGARQSGAGPGEEGPGEEGPAEFAQPQIIDAAPWSYPLGLPPGGCPRARLRAAGT